ncbi:hypothetical protein TRICI_006223 [Trichomonascus ciferrii]|uniref:Thioredoxin domain-containing protein n=1 Tax=Trichomonascus ciferrii TaxID=44093 RepID=A0A642UJX1_9ASCO|nr:hypothetical protein TRICI_006223 [Trichomonascus ciferrii]
MKCSVGSFFVVLFSLIAVGLSAPVDEKSSEVITIKTDDYDKVTSQGTWWIKFFSPYCPHCIEFAPVWEELYGEIKPELEKNDFHMASVDCVEDGDLCDRLDIQSYPRLKMYRGGKVVDDYESTDRTIPTLLKYIRERMQGDGNTEEKKGEEDEKKPDPKSEFIQYPGKQDQVQVNSVYPSSPKPTLGPIDESKPNPKGRSLNLDHTSFTRKVTVTGDGWLVKFHSPRCPHCLAMAPAWDRMAKSMQGELNVGAVNCDQNRQLCKDAKIETLPTIKYFNGPVQYEYKGLRGYGDLLSFAHGAQQAKDPREVNTDGELEAVLKSAEKESLSVFLYFYDSGTVIEDWEALEQVAVSVVGNARVYKTKSKELVDKFRVSEFPSLYAVTDLQRYSRYPAFSPKDIRDREAMVNWAKERWLSLVPQLTPANAHDVFSYSQYVVVGVMDPREQKPWATALKELRATALKFQDKASRDAADEIEDLRAKKQVKIDEARDKGDKMAEKNAKKIKVLVSDKPKVGFAWIDGVFWERWIKSKYGHDSASKPRVIVNDEAGGKFWDVNIRGRYIDASRSQILESLEFILNDSPQLRPKALRNSYKGYYVMLKEFVLRWWHVTIIISLILCLVHTSRGRRRGGFRRLTGGGGDHLPVTSSPDRESGKLD